MTVTEAIFAGSSGNVADKPKVRAPEFAFIGRSNVGKSSLINMLCAKKDLAKTSSKPGKTLLINRFLINGNWYLVDLPGYGFAKVSKEQQAKLKKMIQDYVGKSEDLVKLFVLADSRLELTEIDLNFIDALIKADVDFAIIFTKCDKLSQNELNRIYEKNIKTISAIAGDIPTFITSSEKGRGRDEILDYIEHNYKLLK